MNDNKFGVNLIAELSKSLTEEFLLCAKEIKKQKQTLHTATDPIIALTAEGIIHYQAIRIEVITEIIQRIGNIMKEQEVPILSEDDILAIFGCKTREELAEARKDPEFQKKFQENLKKYEEKRQKDAEN